MILDQIMGYFGLDKKKVKKPKTDLKKMFMMGKGLLIVTVGLSYLLYPWEVIPDSISVIGYADDAIVLMVSAIALRQTWRGSKGTFKKIFD
jgi:uncharacterized membrane protein YkvA (DUF1232 family)